MTLVSSDTVAKPPKKQHLTVCLPPPVLKYLRKEAYQRGLSYSEFARLLLMGALEDIERSKRG